jgi:iron complex outermembrane receptor protein
MRACQLHHHSPNTGLGLLCPSCNQRFEYVCALLLGCMPRGYAAAPWFAIASLQDLNVQAPTAKQAKALCIKGMEQMKFMNEQVGRARLSQGTSLAALGAAMLLATLPTAALAQAADAKDDADEIVVTGFKASLESAVAEKKESNQIVESVTAEDIGKLPDASIGESIARLPGLTSQRLNGRANVIAIRGLGPDFSQTLLNGREQTSTGDNRGVEFDQYPSEVVSQVVVYKTPTASLVGQGLVGTIDIRTVRPLEYGKRVLAVGARGTYADLGALNAGSKKYGYRANATFVDQFSDDTLGLALSASYVNEPYQLQEFNAWGYNNVTIGTQNNIALIGGSKSYVTSTQLKRFGLNGTLQYQASDQLMLTVDGFYSNFNDDQSKRGIELPLGFFAFGTTGNPATAQVANGIVSSGTFNNVRGVVRNDIFQRKADLYSFGYNAKYEGDNGWNGFIDVGFSKTDRNELSLEAYSGTGYNGDDTGNGAAATIGFRSGPTGTVFSPNLNYSDPTRIFLTDPLGWGGSRVQAGYYNNRIVTDELAQYRAEIEREVGGGFIKAVKLGGSYVNRDKSLTPDESFIGLRGGAQQLAIPAGNLLRPTNLSYLGLGPIVSYDARDLIASGVYVLDRNTSNDIPAKAFTVSENIMTGYVQADIESEMSNGKLTGNFGVQAIHTDQSSSGVAFLNGVRRNVKSGAKFWDFLPSANLSVRFDSDFVIRLAAAREIQRPRLDDLRVAISYGVNTAVNPPILSGGGGNPSLRPYRANAFDLNFEKYFGGSGVIAAQLFYKDIKSYITGGRNTAFDYTGFPLPAGITVPSLIGTLDSNVNTGKGKIYGGELSVTLPFATLTSALDGFGVTGGLGYTKSSIENATGQKQAIPGYSKWVANGTVYFEKAGFNARGSARYRSTFLGDFTGFGGSPTRRTALGETIVDAQIGYDFQDGSALQGLSLYLQGQNLTDERFASIDGNRNKVIDYQIYGRRFLAGFTYKF